MNNQGYSVHLKCVHPESNKPPVATVDECLPLSEVKNNVETIVNDVCVSIDPPVADTVERTSSSSAPNTVIDLTYKNLNQIVGGEKSAETTQLFLKPKL